MARWGSARAVLVLVALIVCGGCTGFLVDAGRSTTPKIVMVNSTSGAVDVVSLEPADRDFQDATEDGGWLIAVIPPGATESINPQQYDVDHCLDVPIVVRTADGSELERIDAGQCIEESFTLNIGAE